MFEKTLTDVVKGIRASKRDTALYISQCIAEIKTEINSSDMFVKANALQKLTFLQMMGYSMSWASFATIEVMSSPRFAHKRIGYLAASQGFTQDTDVVLLTTNLLKKELRGAVGGGMTGVYEAGLAVNCIANIVTEDLARDLLPELTNLTQHPQPYLRKKAILCLFKVFVKYPQGLRLTFARLQQCLEDSNPAVVSCAVNVVTELSDKNPRNYLHLAPAFFDLLTNSSNNWMLIKVVKLLGSLVPEEPRLARKLLEPLAAIVNNTQAKSLLYEAVHTITLCLPYCRKSDGSMPPIVPEIVTLSAQTLRSFVEEADQNLKYLGLVGFGSLMQSHPRVLSAPDYRPLILACLSDQDVTIRTRALDLLMGLASRKNLMELVSQLLKHVKFAKGAYKQALVAKVIEMCSDDKYALLQDFAWYLDILLQLGHMRGVETHAELLRAQITDVALRVLPVRTYAVRRALMNLLEREGSGVTTEDENGVIADNGRGKHIMPEILPALAWIVGEYSDLIPDALELELDDDEEEDEEDEFLYDESSKGTYHSIIQVLTTPTNSQKLATTTQKVYVQAAMKVLAAASANKEDVKGAELEACVATIHANLTIYMQSTDVEVVERSFTAVELLLALDLGVGNKTVPNLAPLDDDESSETEDGPPAAAAGDLLGLGGETSEGLDAKAAPNKSGLASFTTPPQSLSARLRDASATLEYIFKPSPMKPSGAKAQRKKRNNPIGHAVDLESPVNVSIFADLIAEETAYQNSAKLSMDSVSFTQQRPLHVQEPVMAMQSISSDMMSSGPFGASMGMANDASASFQQGGSAPSSQGRDPFYLTAAPTSGGSGQDQAPDTASRFGTIQLGDSDEEPVTKKKDKKKKSKKSKKASKDVSSAAAVYHSDEDDDDDHARVAGPGRKKKNKAFDSLAQVDLTTPLRDDEVMPERKHRVVPDRPREPQPAPVSAPILMQELEATPDKSKKKSKKSKKKKKQEASFGQEGDLLDLAGFGFSEPTSSAAAPPPLLEPAAPAPVSTNPVNSAFDDLLGLTAPEPAPAPLLGGVAPGMEFQPTQAGFTNLGANEPAATKPSSKAGKRPWMKGTIKLSSASGVVDWTQVSLAYRIHRSSKGGGTAASVTFRVDNRMPSSAIDGLILDLKGYDSIHLGHVSPGSSIESDKIGPFAYPERDGVPELKGILRSGDGATVTLKISLPASIRLSPQENLSLDQVARELSSPGWSSHSVKVELSSGLSPDAVKQTICAFFRAAEVAEPTPNPNAATYAATSPSGASVRILVKLKQSSVKVDLKCTDSALGQALAGDVKKLQL